VGASTDTVGGAAVAIRSGAPAVPTQSGAPVTLRVRVPVTVDGAIHLDPPPAVAPDVSAPIALAAARRAYGDPRGATRTRIALTSYTNDAQGTLDANGALVPDLVGRLSWAIVDYGGTCQAVGPAPARSASPMPPPTFNHCLTISVIDAHTGAPLDSHLDGGPAVADIALR